MRSLVQIQVGPPTSGRFAPVLVVLNHQAKARTQQRRDGARYQRTHRHNHEMGDCSGLPAGQPRGRCRPSALPKQTPRKKHFHALPHREVAAAVATVRASKASPAGRSLRSWCLPLPGRARLGGASPDYSRCDLGGGLGLVGVPGVDGAGFGGFGCLGACAGWGMSVRCGVEPYRVCRRCSYVCQVGGRAGWWVLSRCWYRVARWWLWSRPCSSAEIRAGWVRRAWAAWVRVMPACCRWLRSLLQFGVGGGLVSRW